MNISRKIATLAAILGASGVVLGALGAHALKPTLDKVGRAEVWDTAAKYHLFHAVAMLALAAMVESRSAANTATGNWLWRASVTWSAGIILFSGSLYCLAIGAPDWTGFITPVGGMCLIAGWVMVALDALRK